MFSVKETAPVVHTAVPLREFAAHLRMGSGFAEDGVEDAVLEACLRAVTAAVEARMGLALIARDYVLTVGQWKAGGQPLAPGPVVRVDEVAVVDAADERRVLEGWALRVDGSRAMIDGALPCVPEGGRGEIRLRAGFGDDANAIPADLRQAVLMLAAAYYESRSGAPEAGGAMPFAVLSLLEPYRRMRL